MSQILGPSGAVTQSPAGAASPASPPAPAYRWRWLILALVLVADVMDLIDSTVVNIAGPSIRIDLGGTDATLQWTLAGYTLAFAIGLVTSGRLGDIFGRQRMFVVGAVGFTLASLMCGLATDPTMLIAFRVVQGLFGAVMIPQGLAVLKGVFPPAESSKAFAAFGPVMGLSAVLGPLLAGVLINADLLGTSWRMIFFINLPLGVFAAVGALLVMPNFRVPGARWPDPISVTLVTVASALLIYPLVQGREHGWPAWAFVSMGVSLVLFGALALNERRSSSPLIEPTLFGQRGFVGSLVVVVCFFGAFSGFILAFNLFLQLGLGFSPLRTSLTMVPWTLGTAVGAAVSGAALAPRFGRAVLRAGIVIMSIGLLGIGLTLHLTATPSIWQLTPASVIAGIGCGFVFAPLFDIALAGVDQHSAGSASGLLNATQQFAGAIGVAALGTLFFQLSPDHGYTWATQVSLLAAVGLFAVALVAVGLLPKRARSGQTVTETVVI